MVEELRLWAIPADAVRQCFAAPPDLAARLRAITDQLSGPHPLDSSPGLLSKLGPLLRHPAGAPLIRPCVPNRHDAEAMMTSRFIETERLSAAWVLVGAWLDDLAQAHATIPLPPDRIDELEFDLVRTGVPTQLSIRHLWQRCLGIPLRAGDDMAIGYMEYASVPRLIDQWSNALPELETSTAEFATAVLAFASPFPQYAEDNSPAPDIIAWWSFA